MGHYCSNKMSSRPCLRLLLRLLCYTYSESADVSQMCQIIHQKDPELLSKTIKAKAKAWRQEKGPLKSTLNLFSSTLPIKNRTSPGSPTYNIGSIKFIKCTPTGDMSSLGIPRCATECFCMMQALHGPENRAGTYLNLRSTLVHDSSEDLDHPTDYVSASLQAHLSSCRAAPEWPAPLR